MYIFDQEIPIFSIIQNLNVTQLEGVRYLEVLDQEIAKISNYYKFNLNSGDRTIEKLVLFNMSTKLTNETIQGYFYEEGSLVTSEVFDMKTISKIVETLIDRECYIPLAASLPEPKGMW
jgi:type IV pilus assembly protein PilM